MDAFDMMSQSAVSKSITEISSILTNDLSHKYIQFPKTQSEVDFVKKRFKDDYKLDGVFALIDGTLVRLSALGSSIRNSFISRRHFPAINMLVIIDSDMRILYINARYPGSTHDTFIWHNSKIFGLLESQFNLEDQSQNIYQNSFMFGDLGYPLEPWLMIPVSDFTDNQRNEKRFNKKQRTIRNKIERFNACFKNRWRCCLGEQALRYKHEKAGKIIYACATLHNFLIHHSFDVEHEIPPYTESDVTEEYGVDMLDIDNPYLEEGKAVRNALIAKMFSSSV
ncbi:putative nuclease HARBI1 [Bradysia coprophila]|uniref:putative nuclease HARBI1 n=1 Tax=Bradysia coprophila TaxID=38358 RepID=UPI00187D97B0|nr:putative nuclease HARBI1 [Bradysia coprophila]